MHVVFVVYKEAGEPNMSAEIQCFFGSVADLSHLVLHCVHFLHWGVTGVTGGGSTDLKIWQVSVREQKSHNNN